MIRNICKVLFTIFVFFILCFVCRADGEQTQVTLKTPIGIGSAGDQVSNMTNSSGCDSRWPCYSGVDFGFRFTLVDYNGKKIEGTRSVDFTGDPNLESVTATGSNKTVDNMCGYRYDFKSKDYCSKEENRVSLYYIEGIPGYGKNSFYDFVNRFMKNDFTDLNSGYKIDGNNYLNFIDLFLHLCGLLKTEAYPHLLKTETIEILASSVILVEPTIPWSNSSGTYFLYGTVSELANRVYNNTINGLDNIFTTGNIPNLIGYYEYGQLYGGTRLCVTDANLDYAKNELGIDLNDIDNFFIKKGAPSFDCVVARGSSSNDTFEKLLDTDVGYGVFLGIIPSDEICKTNCNRKSEVGLLSCDYNGGAITFNGVNLSKPQQYEDSSLSNGEGIYCYDSNVSYDFSNMLSSLNRTDFNRMTYVNPDSGKLNVNRKCYVKSNALVGDVPSKDLFKELEDDYKNQTVTINLYGNNHTISPSNLKVSNGSVTKNFDGAGGILYNYNLTADYIVEKNTLFIGYDYEKKNSGTISVDNFKNAFGKSNNLLSDKAKVYINGTEAADKYDSKLDDKMKCNFSFDVSNPESEINFRVISLENPFPGRDGTSRMPSKNWFYDNNYVYDYILNNRGIRSTLCRNISENCLNSVSPEQMYSTLEPMYRITLTPSTMLAIREYNKNYSYYSMYDTSYAEEHNHENEKVRKNDKKADKLICDEYGRQCYSQFLRDPDYIPQIDGDLSSGTGSLSGKCVLVKDFKSMDDATIRLELSKYLFYDEGTYYLPDLYKYIFGKEANKSVNVNMYDVNYNGRIDNEDYEIIFQYQTDKLAGLPGKNTQYYTCANKSYFSGGPVDVGGDD